MNECHVITFYTPGEFENRAENHLRPSCDRFNLTYHSYRIQPCPRIDALRQKAKCVLSFIHECWASSYYTPFIYTDADSEFIQDPRTFFTSTAYTPHRNWDLRCPGPNQINHYRTGTIAFLPTDKTLETIEMWAVTSKALPDAHNIDQAAFTKAINKVRPAVAWLPGKGLSKGQWIEAGTDLKPSSPSVIVYHHRRKAWQRRTNPPAND